MSSYESFYAGRQGASFVIVKRFDAIDVADNTEFKYKYFALDTEHTEQEYFENGSSDPEHPTPIERNNNNYNSYTWKRVLCNSTTLNFYPSGSYEVSAEYQEGMIQCFNKGGATTSEVNYGEYVIIDTISAGEPNNPDNGKVFRRGMNYDNEMGGAEYIGQIIGPKGNIPTLDFVSYDDSSIEEGVSGSLTVGNDSLIPGYEDGQFNDAIEYKYISIVDEEGIEGNFKIGFQIPYTVLDFDAISEESDYSSELIQRIEPSNHPFYEKWKLHIPKGIRGTDAYNFEIVRYEAETGTNYYFNPSDLGPVKGTLSAPFVIWDIYNTSGDFTEITLNGESCYIKNTDCIKECIRYHEKAYDSGPSGVDTLKLAGFCDTISDVTINAAHKLEITFSDGKVIEIGDPINYIVETALYDGDENAYKYHLLIRFAVMPESGVVDYDGKKWYDVGYVRGEAGGIRIIGNFLSEDNLYDSQGAIPPEYLTNDGRASNPNLDWVGWAVTVGDPDAENPEFILYMYDYNATENNWYPIGGATRTIYVASIDKRPAAFEDGKDIWLVIDTMNYIQ